MEAQIYIVVTTYNEFIYPRNHAILDLCDHTICNLVCV